MEEIKNIATTQDTRKDPDGSFEKKMGNTTYHVTIYFDHEKGLSAKERLERLIIGELRKTA